MEFSYRENILVTYLINNYLYLRGICFISDNDSGFAYLGVNTINLVKYPTYLTCFDVSLSLYPVKFRCCE